MWRLLLLLILLSVPATAAPVVLGEVEELTPIEPGPGLVRTTDAVLKIADRWLRNRKLPYEAFGTDQLRIDVPDAPPLWIEVPVLVAAVANEEYRAEWFPAVGRVLKAKVEQWPRLSAVIAAHPFDAHAGLLWVQTQDSAPAGPDAVVSLEVAPRLHALLMLSTSQGDVFVRQSLLDSWGQEAVPTVERAIQQTAAAVHITRDPVDHPKGYERFLGPSWVAAGARLAFAPVLAPEHRCGVVTGAIENRAFAIQAMNGPSDLTAPTRIVNDALEASRVAWLTGRYEITLHWVHENRWEPYVVTVTDFKWTARPPEALRACLADQAN